MFDSNLTLVHNKAKGKILLAYRFISLNGVYDLRVYFTRFELT